jgi:ADP-heptose:LPS heptosyltransferase
MGPQYNSVEGRIAVLVMGDGIGDAVMRLPFLYALRQKYPNHEIWWIASMKTVMSGTMRHFTSSVIDRVLDCQRLEKPARLTAGRYRKLPFFDIVFDIRARWMTILTARTFMCFDKYYCCLPGFIMSDGRPPYRRTRPLALPARMLTMLDAHLGLRSEFENWKSLLRPSHAAELRADQILSEGRGPYVGIAPGSNAPEKNWPIEKFRETATALASSGVNPVFIVGPNEARLFENKKRIAGAIYYQPAEHPDINSIDLTLAVGSRMNVILGNDSGVTHLMTATNTPLVALFGPTNPLKCGPWGCDVQLIRAQDFGGELMTSIPPASVLSALGDYLGRAK